MKTNSQLDLYFDKSLFEKKVDKKLDNRINIIISSFLILSLLTLFKLFLLGFDYKEFEFEKNYESKKLKRRSIVDRNGNVLAYNIQTHDLIIRTKKVKDINSLHLKLKINFPDLNLNDIKNFHSKSFHIIKKNLSPAEYNKAMSIGEPAIELSRNETRVYTNKNLFSHILGNIDTDHQGVSGLEYSLNDELLKSNTDPLKLSLDQNIQFLIREILINGVNTFSAIGASAILIDADNGKIRSMVSLPDYNLNIRNETQNQNAYFNKNTKGLYELGSVFKTFVIANAIENQIVTKDQVYEDLPSQVACGKFFIKEYKYSKDKKNLSVNDILVESSNIGTIRIIQDSGLESYQKFLNNLEIFKTPKLELPEISSSVKKRWGKCRTLNAGFGHGINTTPIQFSRAFAAIINGGKLLDLSLLENSDNQNSKRVISTETSNIMKQILRTNVDQNYNRGGSGRKADIDGYMVIGKTGTAQKPSKIQKGYSNEILNVFTSAFFIGEKSYVLTVFLDEPKGAPKLWGHSRREAGWNAAYLNGQIIRQIGPILNTMKFKEYSKLNEK